MKIVGRSCLCLFALAAIPRLAPGQAPQDHPLFADHAPLEFRLTAPFGQLMNDDVETPERPAVLSLSDPGGSERSFDIEIRVRGHSRREICRFPPLRIDFDRDATADSVFAGQDHLKLVNLCVNDSDYRDYLAQEYLIYRLLNTLTERSFRVRWVTIEYVDSDGKYESMIEPAFLIEEDWAVAERTGLSVVEEPRFRIDDHEPAHLALIAVFQLLIGNTDWGVLDAPEGEDCCHNAKMLGAPVRPLYALPYDFDFSGLINAEYATPSPDLGIELVTQRVYRGFCALNSELPAAIEQVKAQREAMEVLLEDERVSSRGRRRALRFLDGSFAMIESPNRVEANLIRACR